MGCCCAAVGAPAGAPYGAAGIGDWKDTISGMRAEFTKALAKTLGSMGPMARLVEPDDAVAQSRMEESVATPPAVTVQPHRQPSAAKGGHGMVRIAWRLTGSIISQACWQCTDCRSPGAHLQSAWLAVQHCAVHCGIGTCPQALADLQPFRQRLTIRWALHLRSHTGAIFKMHTGGCAFPLRERGARRTALGQAGKAKGARFLLRGAIILVRPDQAFPQTKVRLFEWH